MCNPVTNNDRLQSKKIGYMYNVPGLLKKCFKPDKPPKERIADIIEEIINLTRVLQKILKAGNRYLHKK